MPLDLPRAEVWTKATTLSRRRRTLRVRGGSTPSPPSAKPCTRGHRRVRRSVCHRAWRDADATRRRDRIRRAPRPPGPGFGRRTAASRRRSGPPTSSAVSLRRTVVQAHLQSGSPRIWSDVGVKDVPAAKGVLMGQNVFVGGAVDERRGLGWLPDYPDLRDYTAASPEVKPLLAKTAV